MGSYCCAPKYTDIYTLNDSDDQNYIDTYSNVKTYQDLLDSNIKFFNGTLKKTYYYLAPWGEGEDQNDHAIKSTNNLIKLHQLYQVYTVDGQSNYSDPEYGYYQRSYLGFLVEISTLSKVYEKLLNDPRIWLICTLSNGNTIGSDIDSIEPIDLTLDADEPYTVWSSVTCLRPHDNMSEFENVNKIIKKLVSCWIICRDFCTPHTADQILVEYFDNIK